MAQGIGKARTDLVTGARKYRPPRRAVDQLDADAVILPFGGIGFRPDQAMVLFLQRVRQHDRCKSQAFVHGRHVRPALQPGEQVFIRRAQPMPQGLNGLDRLVAVPGQDLFQQARRDADAQTAHADLQQGPAFRRGHAVEQAGDIGRQLRLRRMAQSVYDRVQRRQIGIIRKLRRCRPQVRHRLRQLADIVITHGEQG